MDEEPCPEFTEVELRVFQPEPRPPGARNPHQLTDFPPAHATEPGATPRRSQGQRVGWRDKGSGRGRERDDIDQTMAIQIGGGACRA